MGALVGLEEKMRSLKAENGARIEDEALVNSNLKGVRERR